MKRVNKKVLVIMVILSCLKGYSQTEDPAKASKPVFKLGSYYTSLLHFYGRTDSLRSSGFFPVAELWANRNFYISATPVFVANNVSGFAYAGTVTTAGARFAEDNKYAINIYAVKPIYRDNSQLVQSALKWQGAVTYTWLNKFINLTAGADIKISDQADYGATAGIDHIFRKEWGSGFVLVADPTARVNAGTRQFTKTSYRKNGFLFLPGVQQEVTEEVRQFSILSYEFSMPVVLAKNKLQIIINPAYVIPENLVTVSDRPDLSERGRSMFYVTAGANISF